MCSWNGCNSSPVRAFNVSKPDPLSHSNQFPIYGAGVNRDYCEAHESEVRSLGFTVKEAGTR